MLSSRPTRTCPPMASASIAMGVCVRPTPITDHVDALGQQVDGGDQRLGGRRHPVPRAGHELEVQRRRDLALGVVAQRGVDHLEVKHSSSSLTPRASASAASASRNSGSLTKRPASIWMVPASKLAISGRRASGAMRSTVGRFRAGDAAGGEAEDGVGLGSEGVDHLAEDVHVLGAQAGGGVPHVDVQDAGAGPPRGDAFGGDLSRRDRGWRGSAARPMREPVRAAVMMTGG